MTRLVLIRHGEARSGVDRIVGGKKGCTGLTDKGRRQTEALRDRLLATREFEDVAALYTSELPRAIETADILKPALGDHLVIDRHCDLCELHPGDDIDGESWDVVEDSYIWPPDEDPYAPWSPGSEPWAEFVLRVGRKLNELARAHPDQTIVVATHGGVIEASLIVFAELPLRRPFRTYLANTSITEWALYDWHDGPKWTLVRFNDAAHIATLP